MKRSFGVALLISAITCWGAPPEHRKLAPDVERMDPSSNVRVIIQWKGDLNKQHDKVLSRGGTLHFAHRFIKAGTYTLPASVLQELENDPDVKYIAPDRPVQSKLDLTAAAINASYAWNLPTPAVGTGIGVAVIDSGVNPGDVNLTTSSGNGSRVVYSQDFTGGNGNDQYGHGHHISGIIASNGAATVPANCWNCTRTFMGIAPNANIINLRALDANGQATDSTVIAAIEQAIALKSTYNIRVINLSLGRPVYESYQQDPLCQAVEQAWQAGITVVVAAGNSGRDNSYNEQGYGTVTSPGNDPYVITVGSMKTEGTPQRTDDLIASYSSKGPTQVDHIVKPDIVAPGNQIVSLFVNGTLESQYAKTNDVTKGYYLITNPGQSRKASNQFFTLSGTSMAAGVVSGAVADVLSVNPNLTPDQIKALIMLTAYKTFPQSSTVTDSTGTYTAYYDIFTVGAGYLDLQAAIQAINNVPPAGVSAISPSAVYNSATGAVNLSYAPSGVFTSAAQSATTASQSIWSARSIWAASTLNGDQCIGSSQSIWSASTSASSSQSVAGAQSIWAAQSIWSASSSTAESYDNAGEP